MCQVREFNMLRRRLKETVLGDVEMESFRVTGRKPIIRISDFGGKRLESLRDWLREWGDMEMADSGSSSPTQHTGGPKYSGRWEKAKGDPNGYMKTAMYSGSNPGICLYRRGGSAELGGVSDYQTRSAHCANLSE